VTPIELGAADLGEDRPSDPTSGSLPLRAPSSSLTSSVAEPAQATHALTM
jgi:hypothetical protein